MKKIFWAILILINSYIFSEYYPKDNLSALGKSVEAVGLGGSAYGLDNQDETAVDNIALSGSFLRQDFFINTGIFYNEYHSLTLHYFHPTTVGVFSGGYHHFINSQDEDYFFSGSFGFGKEITKQLLFGFKIDIDYFELKEEESNLGLVGSANIVYKPAIGFGGDVFVFENIYLGVGARNVGFVPQTNKKNYLKQMDLFRAGFGFDFINFTPSQKSINWVSRIVMDAALIFPIRENINLGWRNSLLFKSSTLKEFYFSTGYYHNPNLDSEFPLTIGTGFNFELDTIELDINYALVFNDFNSDAFLHKLSLDFRFGELDNTNPEIDTSSFSEKGIIEEGTIE